MRYIRTYEELKAEPKVGDYINVKVDIEINDIFKDIPNDELMYYLENSVGKIVNDNGEDFQQYCVRYEDPDNLLDGINDDNGTWYVDKSEILFYSSDKKEVEEYTSLKKSANKYNL